MARKNLLDDMITVLARKQEYLGEMIAEFEETQQKKLIAVDEEDPAKRNEQESPKKVFDYRVNLGRKLIEHTSKDTTEAQLAEAKNIFNTTKDYMAKLEA